MSGSSTFVSPPEKIRSGAIFFFFFFYYDVLFVSLPFGLNVYKTVTSLTDALLTVVVVGRAKKKQDK